MFDGCLSILGEVRVEYFIQNRTVLPEKYSTSFRKGEEFLCDVDGRMTISVEGREYVGRMGLGGLSCTVDQAHRVWDHDVYEFRPESIDNQYISRWSSVILKKTRVHPLWGIYLGREWVPLFHPQIKIERQQEMWFGMIDTLALGEIENLRVLQWNREDDDDETDMWTSRLSQHKRFGPTFIYPTGDFREICYCRGSNRKIVDPSWYTSDGRWSSSQYEYLGREDV